MTKTDLIAQVAANTEMSKKDAERAVSAMFEALGKAMAEGEKILVSILLMGFWLGAALLPVFSFIRKKASKGDIL